MKIQELALVALFDDGSVREVHLSEEQEILLEAVLAQNSVVSVSETDLIGVIKIKRRGIADDSKQGSQPESDYLATKQQKT